MCVQLNGFFFSFLIVGCVQVMGIVTTWFTCAFFPSMDRFGCVERCVGYASVSLSMVLIVVVCPVGVIPMFPGSYIPHSG